MHITSHAYKLVAVGAEAFGVYFVDAQNEVNVHAFVSSMYIHECLVCLVFVYEFTRYT